MSTINKVIIGDKEYVMHKIAPFAGNSLALKLQKVVIPLIGVVAMSKGGAMDMDVKEVAGVISEHINDKTMNDIIMPMFKLSQVSSVSDNVKIDSEANFNKVFTLDNLADFYELIFEVLKFNYGNFLAGLAERFGIKSGEVK